MLVLRLQTLDDTQPVWAVLNGSSAEWQHGTWSEVLPLTRNQTIVLLIPSHEVLLAHTTVSTRNAHQLKQAIPYALEDIIADDIENQHFVWQVRNGSHTVDAAIIDRQRLRQWMQALQAHGLRANSILPDIFALPFEEDKFTLWQQGEYVWLRTGLLTGMICPLAALPLMLKGLQENQEAPLRLRVYADRATDWANPDMEITPEPQAEQLTQSSLQPALALNLLAGLQDEKQAELRAHWQQWRTAAILSVLTLGLGAGWYVSDTYKLKTQLASANAANTELMKELFPDATYPDDPAGMRTWLESELHSLQNQHNNHKQTNSPLANLALLTTALSQSDKVDIQEIQTNSQTITIDIKAQEQAAVETLKNNLSTEPTTKVEVKSSQSADAVTATLTIGANTP